MNCLLRVGQPVDLAPALGRPVVPPHVVGLPVDLAEAVERPVLLLPSWHHLCVPPEPLESSDCVPPMQQSEELGAIL